MKNKQLTATTLRAILSTGIIVIVAICVAVFIVANDKLKVVAADVSRATIDADASQNNLQTLKTIQAELRDQKDTVARTNSIVADSQSYQYQNQIIADLNDYAGRAGLSITNLDFGATTDSAAAAKPADSTSPAAGATPSAPVGVKSTSVSVTLSNPVPYKNLLNFIHLIEQNLTKMQVSTVGLSANADTGDVTSDTLTIEVYVRS